MTTPTVQPSYAASATLSNAVQALASSATFIAGYESAVFDNSSTKYNEVIVAGKITVGTTPTLDTYILIYIVEPLDDTPTWPDVFDGTESAESMSSVGVGSGFLTLAAVINNDTTASDKAYPFRFSVARILGYVPKKFALYTTHNTGVALNGTGSNQVTKTTGYNDTIPSV